MGGSDDLVEPARAARAVARSQLPRHLRSRGRRTRSGPPSSPPRPRVSSAPAATRSGCESRRAPRGEIERSEHDVGAEDRVVEPAVEVRRRAHPRWRALRDRARSRGRVRSPRRARRSARARVAIARATCATSSACVRRVRWWSSGKTKTCVFPASRRKAVACRIRSRSRSKHVRSASGSSGRGTVPGAERTRRAGREIPRLPGLPLGPRERHDGADRRRAVAVGVTNGGRDVLETCHRRGPGLGARRQRCAGRAIAGHSRLLSQISRAIAPI